MVNCAITFSVRQLKHGWNLIDKINKLTISNYTLRKCVCLVNQSLFHSITMLHMRYSILEILNSLIRVPVRVLGVLLNLAGHEAGGRGFGVHNHSACI